MMRSVGYIDEPRLAFGGGEHIDPRRGIAAYGVYDRGAAGRRDTINVGCVGTSADVEALSNWLGRCAGRIGSVADTPQPNLFTDFPGMTKERGFFAQLSLQTGCTRELRKRDLDHALGLDARQARVEAAVELYYEEVKFLAQNRHVDVIVCVVSEDLHGQMVSVNEDDVEADADPTPNVEVNFRRELKARSMHLGCPIQLVREVTLGASAAEQQDDATKAWNFCTALYYKSGPTVPWKLVRDPHAVTSCAIGIAFYRSRDYRSLGTSLAQVFDELGHGLILRGTQVELGKEDRRPHLTAHQCHDLISAALREYRIAMRTYPARVVVHKSSTFADDEVDGCEAAIKECGIECADFVTVMDSDLALYRAGGYPPYRGTFWDIDDIRSVLYTRGSVWYYQTYPGMYVPRPIEIRVHRAELSPRAIAREVLAYTKLNWNNTQFDGKYPVTLGCARKVGEILKYLDDADRPQVRYAYYM